MAPCYLCEPRELDSIRGSAVDAGRHMGVSIRGGAGSSLVRVFALAYGKLPPRGRAYTHPMRRDTRGDARSFVAVAAAACACLAALLAACSRHKAQQRASADDTCPEASATTDDGIATPALASATRLRRPSSRRRRRFRRPPREQWRCHDQPSLDSTCRRPTCRARRRPARRGAFAGERLMIRHRRRCADGGRRRR
jgi:hypothetical protein